MLIKFSQNKTRLHSRPLFCLIDLQYPIHPGNIHDDTCPYGRAGKVRACSSGSQRHTHLHGIINNHVNIVFRLRENNNLRRNLIDTGINRVGLESSPIPLNLFGAQKLG